MAENKLYTQRSFAGGIARDVLTNRNTFVDASGLDIFSDLSGAQGVGSYKSFNRFTNDSNAPKHTFIPSPVTSGVGLSWILYGVTRGEKLNENRETYKVSTRESSLRTFNAGNSIDFRSGFMADGIKADTAFNWSSKGDVIAFSARVLDLTAYSENETGTPSSSFGEEDWVFKNATNTYIKRSNGSWGTYGNNELKRNGYGIFIQSPSEGISQAFFDTDGNKIPVFVIPETSENFSRTTYITNEQRTFDSFNLGYSSKAPAPFFVDVDNKLFFGYKNIVYATELYNRSSGLVEEDQTAENGLLSDITEDQVGSDTFNYVYLTGGILTLIRGVNNQNTGNFETEEIIKINNDTNEIISENSGLSIARGVTARSIVRDDGILDTEVYITNEVLRLPDEDIIEFMIVNKDRMEIFTNPSNESVGKPKRFSWNRVSEVYEYVVEIDTDIVWCGINVEGITYFIAGSETIIYYANGYDNVKLKKIHNRKVQISRCNRYGIGSYNGIIYFSNSHQYREIEYRLTETTDIARSRIYSFGRLQDNDQIALSVEQETATLLALPIIDTDGEELATVGSAAHPPYFFINNTLSGTAHNPTSPLQIDTKVSEVSFISFENLSEERPTELNAYIFFKTINDGLISPRSTADIVLH